jgi:hypothetical protein
MRAGSPRHLGVFLAPGSSFVGSWFLLGSWLYQTYGLFNEWYQTVELIEDLNEDWGGDFALHAASSMRQHLNEDLID